MPKTSSPGRKRVTPMPTSSTTPATSQPIRHGGSPSTPAMPLPWRVFQSTGFTPAACTRTSTSVGMGSGTGTSWTCRTSGAPASVATTMRMALSLAGTGSRPAGQPPLLRQLLQVRAQGQPGGAAQLGRHVGPGVVEHRPLVARARVQRLDQPALAVQPVVAGTRRAWPPGPPRRDRGRGRSRPGPAPAAAAASPGRPTATPPPVPRTRCPVPSTVSPAKRDPAVQQQAHVVGGVARGGDHVERADPLALDAQHHVDPAGHRGQRRRALGVVGVGVGQGDALDRPRRRRPARPRGGPGRRARGRPPSAPTT